MLPYKTFMEVPMRAYNKKHVSLFKKINKAWGKANKCELCLRKGLSAYEWSSKDHKYKFIREQWWQLCETCHKKYDKKMDFASHERKFIICPCGVRFFQPTPTSQFHSKRCVAKYGKKHHELMIEL